MPLSHFTVLKALRWYINSPVFEADDVKQAGTGQAIRLEQPSSCNSSPVCQ